MPVADQAILDYIADHPGAAREDVIAMAVADGVPDADREQVAAYIGQEFHGLHEGNAIRYRLRAEDLEGMRARRKRGVGLIRVLVHAQAAYVRLVVEQQAEAG